MLTVFNLDGWFLVFVCVWQLDESVISGEAVRTALSISLSEKTDSVSQKKKKGKKK